MDPIWCKIGNHVINFALVNRFSFNDDKEILFIFFTLAPSTEHSIPSDTAIECSYNEFKNLLSILDQQAHYYNT